MSAALQVGDALLRAWPLPAIDAEGDKESRGRVLVIAGSREIAGAAVLAGEAALRVGAGKLAVATPQSAWSLVAAGLPEARVIPLPEAGDGGPAAAALELLGPGAAHTQAVLVGPGMMGAASTVAFVRQLLPLFPNATFVLDALAMDAVHALRRFEHPVVLTPHAGEMAHLTGDDKEDVVAGPLEAVLRHARQWNAVVAVKGACTCIAAPDGRAWRHEASQPGLGTSGSGDVLAGVLAGLLARGATPEQAAVWAVALHARAGERLARRVGTVGYLARELAAEVPGLLA